MHIILGAGGHVGSAVADNLLRKGEKVLVILHNAEKAATWRQKGAQVEIADVANTRLLQTIFTKGDRLFLLNPPARPSTNTVVEEQKTMQSILWALKGSGIKQVVAESTYGAQAGRGIGDLSILYEMEKALEERKFVSTIIRAAYYMSNWDMAFDTAKQSGVVHTLYPVDFMLPMVAPVDIGQIAAGLMVEQSDKTGLHYVEGPAQYSAADVAAVYAWALRKPVKAVATPREHWVSSLERTGFSTIAAKSMAAMTHVILQGMYNTGEPVRGTTSLKAYIAARIPHLS
jgi:uncharacterized protein YbjT (DUF2867 family)